MIRRFGTLVICGALIGAAMLAQDEEVSASSLIAHQEFAAARSLYEQLLKRDPQNLEYQIWIARLSGWLKEYTKSVETYDLVKNGLLNQMNQTQGDRNPVLTTRDAFPTTADTGFPSYFGLDPHARTPYVQQWTTAVWSKYSCGAAVVPEQAAEAFSTADATSPTGLKRSRGGEEQNVVLALVVAFFVIMLLELGERLPQRSFPEQDQMG